MRKLAIIALIWVLLFAVTLVVINEQLDLNEVQPDGSRNGIDDEGDVPGSEGTVLQVNACLVDSSWERGFEDLPVLNVEVDYSVWNVGNVSAEVVTIDITLGFEYYSGETIRDLPPSSRFTDSVSFSVGYDESETITIEACCNNETSSWSCVVDAELPRSPTWSMSKLFITPSEYYVYSTWKEITSGLVPIHWIAIRNWVGKNIEYVQDEEIHNTSEFWQLSVETLKGRTGDCEDFAILLCSLLRADGWSADDVYVVIGENQAGKHHAWVKIRIPFAGWYNIEPQLDGWNTLLDDFLALHGYKAVINFNDQHTIEL